MEAARIQNKLKLLFEKISKPGYVMNSYYTDGFINKISDTLDPDAAKLLALPLLPNLLVGALKDTTYYHNTVNVFLGRLLAIVCRNELHFCKIHEERKDQLLECLSKIASKDMNPSLKVAYLEVAMSLLTHISGVSWLLRTEIWKQILSLYGKSATVFVLRLMFKFSAEFIWKLNDYADETNLNTVAGFILQPIYELDFRDMTSNSVSIDDAEEQQLCEKFEPALQMLNSILSQKDRICYENRVAYHLLKEKSVVTHLYILFDRVRREDTILLLCKAIFSLTLLKVFQAKPYSLEMVYTQEDFMDLVVMYFNGMHFLIQRRNPIVVLDYCGNCNTVFRSACRNLKLATSVYHEKKTELPNQMLVIYLVPILVYVKRCGQGQFDDDEHGEEFMAKFINMSCEHTTRAAYALRDLIMESDLTSVTLQSVKRLTCIKDHLNDEQANIVFQTLFFAFKAFVPFGECSEARAPMEENYEGAEQNVLVMTYIVDIVLSIVKNYNINWQESLEVLCLNSVIHYILMKRKNLTCKFTVGALNLLTVTISKFLPPNLSLLMESQPGSAMHEIGTLLYTKMHDLQWEIRDSALELLNVCTEISYIKFPPLQKQITEMNLISVALTMAMNDHEPYVQVSALRCVGAASRVVPLWDQLKEQHPDLNERLIEMLRHNQEGIVRKEVCNVLCEMYQTGKLSPSFKQVLYEHMASTAMCDFHWEVQISALKFWKIVIHSLLMDQGMLDGTFPPVTFSRETRKIVNLNETEVRKRLMKLLGELETIGCLTALLKLLHDDTEVEVMEAAYAIAQELHKILVKYKVPEHVKYVEGEPKTMAELVCHIKEEVEDSNGLDVEPESSMRSENVIEGILKSDDMSLLANIYQKGMNLHNDTNLAPKVKMIKTASSYLFVNFMETTDYKKIIIEKQQWKEGIRSFSSLLDDVLGMYETGDEELNSLDCY